MVTIWKFRATMRPWSHMLQQHLLRHIQLLPMFIQWICKYGGIRNGRSYYGYLLPLGHGLWRSSVFYPVFISGTWSAAISKINLPIIGNKCKSISDKLASCQANPRNILAMALGSGIDCFRQSDRYSPQSPTNDLGVITPLQLPFQLFPTHLLNHLTLWKRLLFSGDHLWGDYGFMSFRCISRLVGKTLAWLSTRDNYRYDWKLQDRTSMGFIHVSPGKYKTVWQNLASHIEKNEKVSD